jgi:hypothetical protein
MLSFITIHMADCTNHYATACAVLLAPSASAAHLGYMVRQLQV